MVCEEALALEVIPGVEVFDELLLLESAQVVVVAVSLLGLEFAEPRLE